MATLRIGTLLLCTLLAACGSEDDVGSPGATPPAPDIARDDPCNRSAWVAGSVELCEGTLIYRDYVYDDYGADNGLVTNLFTRAGLRGNPLATNPGLLSPTAGDVAYPAGLQNTADLVRLDLAIVGSELVATAELNTLFNADDARLGIAIDTDNNPATGGGAWSPLRVASRGWEVLRVASSGDPQRNRLQLRLPVPAGTVWRVQAVVAQKDGTVMNVAFRGTDEQARADGAANQLTAGNWWEDRQAAALAAGDISAFAAEVRVADLRNRVTRAAPLPVGFHQRVYTSAYSLGEGVALTGVPGRDGTSQGFCEQSFAFLGKYQPYGVYVPPAGTTASASARGLQVVMHGCEANHASQINQANMQARFGDALGRILVAPLGRGPYGFYSGLSERDVLDVMDDIQRRYRIDPEHVISSGYSMGGFGAMHLAAAYPDRFAGIVNWVGFTGSLTNAPDTGTPLDAGLTLLKDSVLTPLLSQTAGSITASSSYENVLNYVGNFRHLPSANLYSGADELVQVNQALALGQRLQAAGVPFRLYLHPVSEHLTFMALDDWRKEAAASADWRRVRAPARVTYRFDPRFDYPEYAIVHDRAYWLSGLRSRTGGEAEADLSAPGCGGREPVFADGQDAGADPVPWVALQRLITGSTPLAPAARLSGSLRNVSAAVVDVTATCLRDRSLVIDVVSDGAAVLSLSDGRRVSLREGRNQLSL